MRKVATGHQKKFYRDSELGDLMKRHTTDRGEVIELVVPKALVTEEAMMSSFADVVWRDYVVSCGDGATCSVSMASMSLERLSGPMRDLADEIVSKCFSDGAVSALANYYKLGADSLSWRVALKKYPSMSAFHSAKPMPSRYCLSEASGSQTATIRICVPLPVSSNREYVCHTDESSGAAKWVSASHMIGENAKISVFPQSLVTAQSIYASTLAHNRLTERSEGACMYVLNLILMVSMQLPPDLNYELLGVHVAKETEKTITGKKKAEQERKNVKPASAAETLPPTPILIPTSFFAAEEVGPSQPIVTVPFSGVTIPMDSYEY